jgi:integrase
LRKRSYAADAYWHLAAAVKGQRLRETLATSSLKHAEALAKAIIDEFLGGLRRPKAIAPVQWATLADLQAALSLLTIKAKLKTRLEYFANLERCLVHALGLPRAQLPAVGLDALTDEAGARLFAWVETEAVKLASQAARNRFRQSWLSMFEQSLALFAPRAEYQLRKTLGLAIPDLKDWRHAAKNHGPHLARESGPAIPDDAIIRRTLAEWVKLGRTPGYVCRNRSHRVRVNGRPQFVAGPLSELDRRNMFLAIGLELSCGLRKSESPRARWDWIKVFNGVPHLSERDTEVKNATGEIHIVPVDPFWNFMLATAKRNGWVGDGASPLLIARPNEPGKHTHLQFSVGGHTDATYWPFSHIGWWLRDLGWETMKTNHALRDFTASMLTMRYTLADASEWCRHSNLATTQRSYNRFVQMGKRVNAKKLSWLRWAK